MGTDKFKIGYFSSRKIDEQFIGAIMITDHQSIPVEFKYTEPIRPTRIHKIIFGKVLEKYIGEDVIKKNLMKEIKQVPTIIFVTELALLGEDQVNRVPMVALQTTTLPGLGEAGEIQRIKDKEVIIQPTTSRNPLKLTFHSPEPDVQERVLNILRSFIDKIDLYEPFSRVENALKSLCLQRG
ncbi:MAG: hypothetical protein GY765_22810 [bacterium]|nr:hypothetical protein [bacterium]